MVDVTLLAASPLDPLHEALGSTLAFFYAIVASYGFAIIMLTIAVRVALIPLTAKQLKSQQAMQRLQPELKKLQAKYKGDRVKLNEEMMKLYKEHKANPLAGCLPLLLQMPLFIVLYRLILDLSNVPPKHIPIGSSLYKAIVASGGKLVSFGIDLSIKPGSVPGGVVSALPYFFLVGLVVATGYFQQRQMSARMPKGDGINNQMQAVMKVFPLFFGVISLSVPAGVVLYFFVSNLWQIGQQAVAFRHMPVPEPAAGGAGGKAGAGKTKGGGAATAGGLGGLLQQAKAWFTGPEQATGGTKGVQSGNGGKGGQLGKGQAGKGAQAGKAGQQSKGQPSKGGQQPKAGQGKGGQGGKGGPAAKGGATAKGGQPSKGQPSKGQPSKGQPSKGTGPAKGSVTPGAGATPKGNEPAKGGQPAKAGGTSNGGRPVKAGGTAKGGPAASSGGTPNGKAGVAGADGAGSRPAKGANANANANSGDGSRSGAGQPGAKAQPGKSGGKGGIARYRRAPKPTRPPPAPRPKGLPPTTGSSGG